VLVGAAWGAMNWDVALKFLNRVSAGVSDPILGRDAGFYLFALPFYDFVYWLLLGLAFISLLAAAVFLFMPRREEELRAGWWERGWDRSYADYRPSYAALGAMGLVIAWGYYLNIFHLMYSRLGAVAGPGWTDAHVRWPAYWIMVAVAAAAGSWLLMLAVARRLHDWAAQKSKRFPPVRLAGIPVAALAAFWFLALQLVPGAVQWLVVEPNEITVERPYIEHNIEFTRRAFQLDKVEERQFPASAEFTRQTAEQNQHVLSQVRLWDPRALVQVYKQFQEIRLYYEFADVDIDRYTIAGEYRQVMVSPREMNLENLPSQSQTFVNRHFKYSHGYGLTLAPVNEFTSNGLPALLVKDLPPATEQRDLKVARPQIYYGELTDDYVVADSKEEEFDYPSGQENVYTHYEGRGGVQLDSLWRRLVYGWKLGGTRLLFSSYSTDESRILFRRQVRQRVRALAPFLHFDRDPYIVLADGKLYWIIDAYTTSAYYPYSQPFSWWMSDAGQRMAQPTTAAAADYLHGANCGPGSQRPHRRSIVRAVAAERTRRLALSGRSRVLVPGLHQHGVGRLQHGPGLPSGRRQDPPLPALANDGQPEKGDPSLFLHWIGLWPASDRPGRIPIHRGQLHRRHVVVPAGDVLAERGGDVVPTGPYSAGTGRRTHPAVRSTRRTNRLALDGSLQQGLAVTVVTLRAFAVLDVQLMVPARRHDAAERHAVLGERAGFIRENDSSRPQRFHGRQPIDQRLAPRHQPHAAGQGDGGDDRQSFGNCGDAQRDCRFDHQHHRPAGGQAHQGYDRGHGEHDPGEASAQLIQTPLQGRGLLLRLLSHFGDAPQLRLHSRGDHHAFGRTFGNGRAAKQHARPFGQRLVGPRRLRAFYHGDRLARPGGFIDAEVVGLDQPQIRRHHVAALLEDDVARHQIVDRRLAILSAAAHADARLAHFPQGFHRTGGPPLGRKPDQPVDQHHRQNCDAFGQFAHCESQTAGRQEHQQHHALELLEQDLPKASPPSLA